MATPAEIYRQNKVIDDSFYFGVEEEEEAGEAQQFPATFPFSATVPEIGLALLKVCRSPPVSYTHLTLPTIYSV